MKIKLLLLLLLLLFSCSSKHDSSKIYDYKNNYWTNDLEEIELVMSYIFNIDDYQKIIQMDAEEKIRFLDEYWDILDPNPDIVGNDLLDELNSRVTESKELFSGFDGGLLSDRAKIYIIYGPPSNMYKTYINNSELITWNYKTGYEFNFIGDSFGRYKLTN